MQIIYYFDLFSRISTMMCSSRFQSGMDQSPPGSPAKPRVYASVAEMKRKGKVINSFYINFYPTPSKI